MSVPLFVSRRRLVGRKSLPRAAARWALDSGAFTEIGKHGQWTISAAEYAKEVVRYSDEIGGMDWASPQDWMCEPPMLAKTGLTIVQHQRLTTESYLRLRDISPSVPWIPVLQGWLKDDYLDHVEQYLAAGIDLTALRVVGLGSVCRRQGTGEFVAIVRALVACGISLHAFGVKTIGLSRVASLLTSSDSMSWSDTARRLRRPGLPQCVAGSHINCANCLPFALKWRLDLLQGLPWDWQI